jgi:hypothetical protein
MRLFLLPAFCCLLGVGCNGHGKNDSGDPSDAVAVYGAVLQEELKGTKKGEGFYVFVDGKDPEPELLQRFQKQWPELQAGSKAPQGKANRVSMHSLKWFNRDTADVLGGSSNGIDGRQSRYRVVRKNGAWVVESARLEAQS